MEQIDLATRPGPLRPRNAERDALASPIAKRDQATRRLGARGSDDRPRRSRA
jgi:hypothetical protein